MKTLIFTDGTEILVDDTSTVQSINATYEDYAEIDGVRSKFTEENIKEATLDGEPIANFVFSGTSATAEGTDGAVSVHYMLREKTELEILQEKVEAQAKVISELTVAQDNQATAINVLNESQNTQDSAIEDLGEAVSDLAGEEE